MNYQGRQEDETIAGSAADPKASQMILDVLVIGAGFSGICMGYRLLKEGMSNFVILEKTDGIGGTWYKNTYPGAACDVPSHFYCFSFAPNPDWSRVYSPQAEIRDYIEDCANRFKVTPHIHFGSSVEGAVFDEEKALWTVTLEGGKTYQARHLVAGTGGLNIPMIPDLPGLKDFEGRAFHTAQWQSDVDLAGKNVTIIGSAASAIQLIPQVAKVAKKVTIFQRTPNFIAPRNDRAYTEAEKKAFREKPWKLKMLRWRIFWRFDLVLTPLLKRKSFLRKSFTKGILKFMRSTVQDPVLQEKLVPDFKLGCKRILISDDFYPSLNRQNVELITDGVDHIEADAVIDGKSGRHETDVLVLATGFDLHRQMTSIDLVGEGGVSLKELWKDEASAYEGGMVPGFPNAYFVTGPNTGVGSTSVVFMIEAQVDFIMNCLRKTGKTKLLQPKADIVEKKNITLQKELQNTVWATGCKSWYKAESGKIHTLYPYSASRFRKDKKKLRMADFILADKKPEQCGT
ncbi:MAG: NAD(P)/FAD-dependent oxidoreductase [Sneathiella sp.]